jgi:hypothetical protein
MPFWKVFILTCTTILDGGLCLACILGITYVLRHHYWDTIPGMFAIARLIVEMSNNVAIDTAGSTPWEDCSAWWRFCLAFGGTPMVILSLGGDNNGFTTVKLIARFSVLFLFFYGTSQRFFMFVTSETNSNPDQADLNYETQLVAVVVIIVANTTFTMASMHSRHYLVGYLIIISLVFFLFVYMNAYMALFIKHCGPVACEQWRTILRIISYTVEFWFSLLVRSCLSEMREDEHQITPADLDLDEGDHYPITHVDDVRVAGVWV